MEISSLLHFGRRNLLFISLITVFFIFMSGFWTYFLEKKQQEILIFVSLGTEKLKSDALSKSSDVDLIEAADKFGETIIGWFKNPGFIKKIQNDIGTEIQVVGAKKQAMQNLAITLKIPFSSESQINDYGSGVLNLLKNEINEYNSITKNNYAIATNYISGNTVYPNYKMNLVLGFLLGLFVSIFLIYFWELFLGVISFDSQIQSIFPETPVFTLNKSNSNGILELCNFIAAQDKMIILAATLSPILEFMPSIITKISEKVKGKTLLIDHELKERKLKELFAKDRNSHLGISDAKNEDDLKKYLIEVSNDENIFLIPAGEGKIVDLNLFEILKGQFDKLLIYSSLPLHSELTKLENKVIFLFVKVGQTEFKDLKLINEL